MKHAKNLQRILFPIIVTVYSVLVIIPVLTMISASFSDSTQITIHGFGLLPRGFTLDGYAAFFSNGKSISRAFLVSLLTSTFGTAWGVSMNVLLAFVLTKKSFAPRRAISFFLYFTTLFSGGTVATYILKSQYLHMTNTLWVYFIPGISAWSVFIMRTNLQKVPYEVQESAIIDGANEFTILTRIMIPMSKPVIAYSAYTTFVGIWNDYTTPMYFINNSKFQNLQYVLQSIFLKEDLMRQMKMTIKGGSSFGENTRFALAVLSALPIMLSFPFFQKYFVKGIALGSVKG